MAQKEHLSTIGDLTSGVPSVAGLKKKIEYLESELDAAKLALDELEHANEEEENDPDDDQIEASSNEIKELQESFVKRIKDSRNPTSRHRIKCRVMCKRWIRKFGSFRKRMFTMS
ncbi:unnamed protein product [Arabis nemorensis]|uniref:Uncharacterized protein n=1 Tax=Arabis nemorensis TaxID=586526 RepID=A0A565BFH3_9BRAS|nr:unnamed protein product [Arabis nemorensis]